MQPFGHNKHWAEKWGGGCACPFLCGGTGPHLTQCGLGRGLPPYKWYLDPSSCLATKDMGRKLRGGSALIFWGGGAGSPSSTMWPGQRPTFVSSAILIHPAVWPQPTWAKNWGAVPPFGEGGVGSPSNTMWPGPRATCVPSFILIRPTVWPQYANVTDRQVRQKDRQTDNGLIA